MGRKKKNGEKQTKVTKSGNKYEELIPVLNLKAAKQTLIYLLPVKCQVLMKKRTILKQNNKF